MAVWGFAPSDGDLPLQAFACAQEMVRMAADLCFGGQPITIGVGLNAGEVFIGNVGGEGKRQVTVLGTPVNLAARYESESKALNAPIVVGQAFYDRLPADAQRLFTAHENRLIKGAEAQTLYTYRPVLDTEKGIET
jgi:class 3 adenylate cyclase